MAFSLINSRTDSRFWLKNSVGCMPRAAWTKPCVLSGEPERALAGRHVRAHCDYARESGGPRPFNGALGEVSEVSVCVYHPVHSPDAQAIILLQSSV